MQLYIVSILKAEGCFVKHIVHLVRQLGSSCLFERLSTGPAGFPCRDGSCFTAVHAMTHDIDT